MWDLCFIIISSLDKSSEIFDIRNLSLLDGPEYREEIRILSNSERSSNRSFLTEPKEACSHADRDPEMAPSCANNWFREHGLSELQHTELITCL